MTIPGKTFPLLAAMSGIGAIVYWYTRKLGKKRDRERCESAFAKLETGAMTPRQIWDAALDLHRKERQELGTDVYEMQGMCHQAEDLLKLSNGIKAFVECGGTGRIPDFVMVELFERWTVEFFSVFPSKAFSSRAAQWEQEVAKMRQAAKPHPNEAAWRWGLMMALSQDSKRYALRAVRMPGGST